MALRFAPVLAISAALAAMGVAGCGSGQSGSDSPAAEPPPPLSEVRVLADARDVALPLDHYKATEQQAYTLIRARDILTVDCMRRFGFNRSLSAPVEASKPPGGRYGISYGPEVDKYGYHQPPERAGAQKQANPNAQRPSAAELGVERGDGAKSHQGQQIPDGGCIGEADRTLLGPELAAGGNSGTLHASDLALRLEHEARNVTDADGRLLDVFGKWSECMKRAGYDYRGPWDANDDPDFETATAAPREIATAQADLRCRTEFNVNGTYFALEVAYQQRAIEHNAEALREKRAQLDERIRKATDIVAGKN